MPALVLLAAVAAAASRADWRRSCGRWTTTAGLLLLAPYLFGAVLFAQAMTIHPYTYDYFLQFPLSVLGGMTMLHVLREPTDGRPALFFAWVLAAGVMANLIAIAQGARAALGG